MRPSSSIQMLLALLIAGSSASAQTTPYTVEDAFGDLPPTASKRNGPAPPKLAFKLDAEIALPGPLPPVAPRWRDGGVEVTLADGTVLVAPVADAVPRPVEASATEIDPHGWVEDAAGKARYRSTGGGWIEAQKRCRRCKKGWKKRWRLRVAGNTPAPPIVFDGRLYFGALDNRVYCVKAKNGHRVWVSDVGDRASLPLVHWESVLTGLDADDPTAVRQVGLILVVPDSANRLVALDRETGGEVAMMRLGDADGRLIGIPVATDRGSIAVAKQAYAAGEASLLVFRMMEIEAPLETAPAGEEPAQQALASP